MACWIERSSIEEAEQVSRDWISRQSWEIESLEESYPIDRSAYGNDPSGLEYFEQALIDHEVYVFHTYPVDDRECT